MASQNIIVQPGGQLTVASGVTVNVYSTPGPPRPPSPPLPPAQSPPPFPPATPPPLSPAPSIPPPSPATPPATPPACRLSMANTLCRRKSPYRGSGWPPNDFGAGRFPTVDSCAQYMFNYMEPQGVTSPIPIMHSVRGTQTSCQSCWYSFSYLGQYGSTTTEFVSNDEYDIYICTPPPAS